MHSVVCGPKPAHLDTVYSRIYHNEYCRISKHSAALGMLL